MPSPQNEAKPSIALAGFGRWSFIASLIAGFAIGVLLLPFGGNPISGAAVALGALAIMAATAMRAGRAEAQVEALQLKLLDERSYHAFSRIEGGLLDLEDSAVRVDDMVSTARDELAARGRSMPAVHVQVPSDLPSLRADPKRLHQILMHVLSNASKFTSKNGRIEIGAKVVASGGLALIVRDTGIGMAVDPRRTRTVQAARRRPRAPFRGIGARPAARQRFDAAPWRRPGHSERARTRHDGQSLFLARAHDPACRGPGRVMAVAQAIPLR